MTTYVGETETWVVEIKDPSTGNYIDPDSVNYYLIDPAGTVVENGSATQIAVGQYEFSVTYSGSSGIWKVKVEAVTGTDKCITVVEVRVEQP